MEPPGTLDAPPSALRDKIVTKNSLSFPSLIRAIEVPIPSDSWKESGVFTASADDVLEHRFSFYGETHQLPGEIDWEFNPGTDHWVVDLNRFTFLDTLCRAAQSSGDSIYAEKCLDLILSWIRQSQDMGPAAERVMCRSYLNVAIHLRHWVKALGFIEQGFPSLLSPERGRMIRSSIEKQVHWLDKKIPSQSSNWIFIGCKGILVTLAYLPTLPHRAEVAERAWTRIEEALADQVLPDGVHEEMSPHYHAVVVSHVIGSLDHLPILPPCQQQDRIEAIISRMLVFLAHTLTPDNSHLAFNDGDADYGPRVRQLLNHPLAKRLLGETGNHLASRCFPFAGTMFLREGSHCGSDELYLAFDGGSYGTNHAHEDKLGFWLTALGRSFLVDPGRHLYDQAASSFRGFLSSTAAHSTITIDGLGQNCRDRREEPGIMRAEKTQPIYWHESRDGSVAAGAFYDCGYGPEFLRVVHQRVIFFFPDLGCWSLVDEVNGENGHLVESRLQFAPGGIAQSEGVLRTSYPDVNLAVLYRPADWTSVRIEQGQEEPRRGWYSRGYNRLEPAPSAVFCRQNACLPLVTCFSMIPFRNQSFDSGKGAEAERRALAEYPAARRVLTELQAAGSTGSKP